MSYIVKVKFENRVVGILETKEFPFETYTLASDFYQQVEGLNIKGDYVTIHYLGSYSVVKDALVSLQHARERGIH